MYTEKDLVRIAKRENNNKRGYLVVNPLQGKHIPVSPGKAAEMFSCLAMLLECYKDERLLVVGFAETATAIGAQIAIDLGAYYIQTTRERIPGADYLLFSEEHSHATEQRLVNNDLDQVMEKIDRIIFAEDEVTTGRTIGNLIGVLERRYGSRVRFSVASLLNGMPEEALGAFADRGVRFHYLVKTRHDRYAEIAAEAAEDGVYLQEAAETAEYTACIDAEGWMDTRRLVDAKQYRDACRGFSEEIRRRIPLEGCRSILVLGTEEFMFPGLYAGKCLEEGGYSVRFHATTRSPAAVSGSPGYPLHERYGLSSLYEEQRRTFVYDIGSYDAVIVTTDAQKEGTRGHRGEMSLLNAVRRRNETVYLVRWCGK